MQGSDVASTNGTSLLAGRNVLIDGATESFETSHAESKKKSGLMSSGGIGVTLGSSSLKTTQDDHTEQTRGSTIGSVLGNVDIQAGKDLTIRASDLVAGKDINLIGQNVSILEAQNQNRSEETREQKKSGLTLALSGSVGSAVNTAYQSSKEARHEDDSRLAALKGIQAGLTGYQAWQASQQGGGMSGDTTGQFVGIALSLGTQQSKSKTVQEQSIGQGSTLTAGNNLNILATGAGKVGEDGDIRIQGSQLKAGQDVMLAANRDLILEAAANTQKLDGKNSSSGGNIGASIGVGSGGAGISIFANGNKGTGFEHGNGTTWTETTVDAGRQVTLISGRDTSLIGAQVNGEQITAKVGRDLTLRSLQDTDEYKSEQKNVSGGASFTLGTMTGSAYVSVDKSKIHSNYDSVQEQTGLYAGKGGYDIEVGKHTQLDGAVISSTANADKNRLSTDTLGWRDIRNEADYKTQQQGINASTGGNEGSAFFGNMPNGMVTAYTHGDSDSGTTHSAISAGTLDIRNGKAQQQDVASLSRDVEHANGSISPIFDKEKEQRRLQEVQLIAQIGSQTMDIIRTNGEIKATKAGQEELDEKGTPRPGANATAQEIQDYNDALANTKAYQDVMREYGTGSNYQKAAQAVTAALQYLAGGDIGGAVAGASAPYVARLIKDQTGDNDTARIMAQAVLGAIVANAQGNSGVAGAAGAATGELIAASLYPNKSAQDLTENERQIVSALSTLAAGMAGGLATGDSAGVVAAAGAGKTAVENNAISDIAEEQMTGVSRAEKYEQALRQLKLAEEEYKAQVCAGLGADACSAKMDANRAEMFKGAASLGADFVPVVGDIKSFAEAQSSLDYLAAVIGIVPVFGDVAGKTLKAAEKSLKAGDVEQASKLINIASNQIQDVQALDVGAFKELKAREVVGDGLEHDHIPSFAALRKAKENEIGRPLTDAEARSLYQNATAVEVPKDVHIAGPTYGGKNTASQVNQDALDLCGAICRDTNALRTNMVERGYDPALVEDAIKSIIERNRQTGVTN